MRSTRLNFALDTGAIALPENGSIVVYRPNAGDDLQALPMDRVLVVQGFKPDHDAFAARGYKVAVAGGTGHAAAMVCLPRAKAEAHALIAEAARSVVPGGLVIVDGQKTDGADAIYREMRGRMPVSEAISKAHGKIFTFPAGPGLEDWISEPMEIGEGFQTVAGVFSADAPDRGSMLLAAILPARMPGYVVDLGAGWGFLARAILARSGVKKLDLVEAEAAALDCARVNVVDERARFHWADATTYRADGYADFVVCNPPFHAGRDADPSLGLAFLQAAARMLSPNGELWLVANRHLPYAKALATLFRDVEEVGGDSAFRLTRAARPNKPSRAAR
ncbi:MAG: methyltransferase [Paracoccaceae bacterium]